MTYNGHMYILKKEWYVFKEKITVNIFFEKIKAIRRVYGIYVKLTTKKKDA